MNWEALIAGRIAMHRDTYAPQRIEDAGKRNASLNQKRWRENNPDKVKAYNDRQNLRRRTDHECIQHRRELECSPARKAYKAQYRKEHKERINELHRNYNATENGRAANAAYNKKWRESHKEYDRERKQKWWRLKHPNPRPVGRPRKETP